MFVSPGLHNFLQPLSASLRDPATGEIFPVVRGIPRFCAPDNYSESFGFQWN